MALVDTSFLMALTLGEDRFHDDAMAIDLARDRNWILSEIWVEYWQAMTRLARPEELVAVSKHLAAGPFQIQPFPDAAAIGDIASKSTALNARMKKDGFGPLSIFDLLLLDLSAKYREGILTFDGGIGHAVRAKLFPGARLAN